MGTLWLPQYIYLFYNLFIYLNIWYCWQYHLGYGWLGHPEALTFSESKNQWNWPRPPPKYMMKYMIFPPARRAFYFHHPPPVHHQKNFDPPPEYNRPPPPPPHTHTPGNKWLVPYEICMYSWSNLSTCSLYDVSFSHTEGSRNDLTKGLNDSSGAEKS